LINNSLNLTIVVINLLFFNVPLLTWYFLILIIFICYPNYLLLYHSYLQIFLKLVDFLAIILFSLDKPILSSSNIILDFIIFIINLLFPLDDCSKALIPVTWLWIIIKFFHFTQNNNKLVKTFKNTYIHEDRFLPIGFFEVIYLLKICVPLL